MPERAVEVTRTYSPVAGRSVTIDYVPAVEVTEGAETRLAFEPVVVETVQGLVRKALSESKSPELHIRYRRGDVRNEVVGPRSAESAVEFVLRRIDWSARAVSQRDALLKAAKLLLRLENNLLQRIETHLEEDRVVVSIAEGAGKTAIIELLLTGAIYRAQSLADVDDVDRTLAAFQSLSRIPERTMGTISLQLRGPHGTWLIIDREVRPRIVNARAFLRKPFGFSPLKLTGIVVAIQLDRFSLRTNSTTMDFLYDEAMRDDAVDLLGQLVRLVYVIGSSSVPEALDLEPA
jgi:hypothetical protein